MTELYISLDEEALKRLSPEAKKEAEATYEDAEAKNKLLFPSVNWNVTANNIEFSNGNLNISGDCDLGYVSASIDLSMDDITDIIDYYVKKINQMKAVLEATKN